MGERHRPGDAAHDVRVLGGHVALFADIRAQVVELDLAGEGGNADALSAAHPHRLRRLALVELPAKVRMRKLVFRTSGEDGDEAEAVGAGGGAALGL